MSYETSEELRQALKQNHGETSVPVRCVIGEELAEAAEQLGDDVLLATALCELMSAYRSAAELGKVPVTLARLLKLHDQNRDAFGDWERHRMYWFFKWVTSSLLSLPAVPLLTVREWVDQMNDRYAEAGLKRHAVHAMRYQIAEHTGADLDVAYEGWSTRPRDEMSDCEACEARSRGTYYAVRGDDSRALTEWQPVLDGKLTCSEEPAATAAAALAAMVRAGRLQDAASAHRTGYRLARGKANLAAEAAYHIEFCGLTGNTGRGVELLAESRGHFTTDGSLTDLRFLGGVHVLLARLVADGHGGIPVAGPPGASYTAESLLESVARDGAALAARFDARNGTTWIGDHYRLRCAAQPLTKEPLPLGLRGAATVPLPRAAQPAAPVAPAASDAEASSAAFPDLLARARKLTEAGRPEADQLWARIAGQVADADSDSPDAPSVGGVPVDDLLRAELASHLGYELARSGQWAQARAEFARARAAFTAAAEPGRAIAAESRSYWCALPPAQELDPGEVAVTWASLDQALSDARSLLAARRIDAASYLVVIQSRAVALLQRGESPDSSGPGQDPHGQLMAECELLRSESLRLGVPHRAAAALMMRAHVAAGHGDSAGAEIAVRTAVDHLQASGRPWLLPPAYAFLAQLLIKSGHADQAMTMLHEALTHAAAWPDKEFNYAGALMLLGEACSRSGDQGAAAGHIAEAASRFDRQGDARSAAAARAALGQTLLLAGRPGDAVAVLESVRDEGAEQLPAQQQAQARLDLGRGLRQLGEHRAAAEEFVGLADLTASWSEQPMAQIMAVAELAAALAAAGLWDQADAAAERALSLHEAVPHPAAICRMLRGVADSSMRLRGSEAVSATLGYLDRADAVNVAAAEEPDRYARWPETAQTAELRARVLADAGQHDEALTAADLALLAYQAGGDQSLAQQAEVTRIAAIMEGLRVGRSGPAVERLTAMISRCQAAGLADKASQLTGLRDSLAG